MHEERRAPGRWTNQDELINSTGQLNSADGQKLRTWAKSIRVPGDPGEWPEIGVLLAQNDLNALKMYWQILLARFNGSQDQAAHHIMDQRFTPTKAGVFNALLVWYHLSQSATERRKYLEIVRCLSKTCKVKDVRDVQGQCAFDHAYSTKPFLELEFAELLWKAGGDPYTRNRYGGIEGHEIVSE